MALFQQKTIDEELKKIKDETKIKKAFKVFQSKFQDPKRQAEILKMNELQYQRKFLADLFVETLDYIERPDHGFCIECEIAGTTAERADGAINKVGNEKHIIGVIELKDKKTKDFKKIEKQAFKYHVQHDNCRYIITSNFQQLRLYIDTNEASEEFDLFKMPYERFRLMYLYLHKDNLLHGLPMKIREASIVKEKDITKKFYDDYKAFRTILIDNILANNGKKYDKRILVKKTQKLLDRLLFIFFAEDKGLIKLLTSKAIIGEWEVRPKDKKDKPLYDYFKQYFGYLNKGFKSDYYGTVHAYNGGLFAPDEILDNLIIFDNILSVYVPSIERYDFKTEINANILGHIFEQSLNDLEEFNNSNFDPKKSKRKKDGVFYTPTYITKYIVEHTVGALCRQKETELGLNDDKKISLKAVHEYRTWLLGLTVLDPACGSGAFLNETLDFFIAEHRHIDELEANIQGKIIVFQDYSEKILANNIFGVDINEESVEIAQLSLWLHTAVAGRKLVTLNKNIQCGNSLISDPKIAGDKAFDWKKAFPTVFKNGGFDVVLGNPPYGAALSENDISYFKKNYQTFEYQANSYVLFYEKGMNILNKNGILSYITPFTFANQHYFSKLRGFFKEFSIERAIKYQYQVFEDANIGDTISIFVKKHLQVANVKVICCKDLTNATNLIENDSHNLIYSDFILPDGTYNFNGGYSIIKKALNECIELGKVCDIIVGIKPYQTGKGKPKQTPDIVEAKNFTSTSKETNQHLQCAIGSDFHRYTFLNEPKMFLKYGIWLAEPREGAPFFENKIIIRQTSDKLICHFDTNKYINLNNVYNVGKCVKGYDIKYILAIMNSKIFKFIYQSFVQEEGKLFPEVKKRNLERLPIKVITEKEQQKYVEKADIMLDSNKQLHDLNKKFEKRLQGDFKGIKLNKVLEKWHKITFYDFKKEVEKLSRPMLPKEKEEWIEVLEIYQSKAKVLLNTISSTDGAIDKMVYELYGLTKQEIEIIENQ